MDATRRYVVRFTIDGLRDSITCIDQSAAHREAQSLREMFGARNIRIDAMPVNADAVHA